MDLSAKGISTRAVHAGEHPDDSTGALVPPIYQTSTFAFKNAEQGARLFSGDEKGYIYTRLSNPTTRVLENKLALLEGGDDAVATASGMAAISTVVSSVLQQGDHLVSARTIYGATYTLFEELLPRMGISVSFADGSRVSEVKARVQPNTRMIFIETPGNPTLDIVDIAAVAEIARETGATLVVDNTFATFCNQRPLEMGAHVVVHSATKYIGGHSDVVAGAIIGSKELVDTARGVLKLTGAILGPFDAWLLIRGLKTMALRVARQNETAQKLAEFLCKRPEVSQVFYPGLPDHPNHHVARHQMSGFGGVLSFELKGGIEAGRQLMNSVQLCTLAVSLGGVETLIEHPASMTHAKVPRDVREKAGITDGLVRLAVGVEDVEDIIEDLAQALDRQSASS
jgi:methionine-gamma-lyase